MPEQLSNICGYQFVSWLKPERTALCRADNGRLLVLKRLDDDCLLHGELHPDIRDRLAHIREMAHAQLATLISVEREPDGKVWMVREHIEGKTIRDWACDSAREQRQALRILRELTLAIETLNGLGIVHGRLCDGNVIVDSRGEIRLLDLSPLLHQDETQDARALCSICEQTLGCRDDRDDPNVETVVTLTRTGSAPRELSAALGRALQTQTSADNRQAVSRDDERGMRRHAMRYVLVACAVTLLAAAIGLVIFSASHVKPLQAPPEAMLER